MPLDLGMDVGMDLGMDDAVSRRLMNYPRAGDRETLDFVHVLVVIR